jgi:hypothetical protein
MNAKVDTAMTAVTAQYQSDPLVLIAISEPTVGLVSSASLVLLENISILSRFRKCIRVVNNIDRSKVENEISKSEKDEEAEDYKQV